jgi:hypothetical protein
MHPLANEVENILMASLYLEGDAYDWFVWWSQRIGGLSVNWKMFKKDLFKIFHVDEEDDIFTKFTLLRQIVTVNEYIHEWEVLTTRVPRLTEEPQLKMYIARLNPNICGEPKLWRPVNTTKAIILSKMIERKFIKQQRGSLPTREDNQLHSMKLM